MTKIKCVSCKNKTVKCARNMCKRCYKKWWDKNNRVVKPPKIKNRTLHWLRRHKNYEGDNCLIFPFARITSGYGQYTSPTGKRKLAHRAMCRHKHGPAPSPIHQASHSCGNGHNGCVNPNHLFWKTPKENCADRVTHGTLATVLTTKEVKRIKKMLLKGNKSLQQIADIFGVTKVSIFYIKSGKTWNRVTI